MLYIPFLSGLDNNMGMLQEGKFQNLPGVDLKKIATNMCVNVSTEVVGDSGGPSVRSIPDIWARVAMYESILCSSEGESLGDMYKKCKNEWRGVLTMLALRIARGIEGIDVKTCKITEGTKFDIMMSKLFSEKLLRYSKEIKEVQVITFHEKPLAFIWPNLVVCPVAGIELAMSNYEGEVPWYEGKCFQDPVASLNSKEKSIVNSWLQKMIITAVTNTSSLDEIKKGATEPSPRECLIKLIKDFCVDLGDVDKGLSIEEASGDTDKLVIRGDYEKLGTPYRVKVNANDLNESDVLMLPYDGKKFDSELPKILVLVNNLDEELNIAKKTIRVLGTNTFNSVENLCRTGIISDSKSLNGINLSTEDLNAEVWGANDFFSDRIVAFSIGEDKLPNCYWKKKNLTKDAGNNQKIVFPVLPIREKLLKYFSPEDISKNLTIEEVTFRSGGIIDSIKVELSISLNKGKKIKLHKIYESDEIKKDRRKEYREDITNKQDKEVKQKNDIICIIGSGFPTIQIWPNFVWDTYYSFCADLKSKIYFEPYGNDAVKADEQMVEWRQDETFRYRVNRWCKQPSAFLCKLRDEKSKDELGIVGVNCEKMSKPETDIGKTCLVGVDFGTTNTTAYVSDKDGRTTHLSFKNRLYPVIDTTVETEEYVNRYFFPMKIHSDKHIRSIFHMTNRVEENGKPFVRGNIYYDSSNIVTDSALVGKLDANLKWNDDTNRHNTVGFLTQFCLQCLAEIAFRGVKITSDNVKWKYSYPSSYTSAELGTFGMLFETKVMGAGGTLNDIFECSFEVLGSKPECAAAAEYFKTKQNANVTRGFCCFDIGGGSTDIAVWKQTAAGKGDYERYQGSLRFAGIEILNSYFRKKADQGRLFEVLKIKSANDKEESVKDYNSRIDALILKAKSTDVNEKEAWNKSFPIQLEELLKYHQELLVKQIQNNSNNLEIIALMRRILFALSGLFFYMGHVVAYLKINNLYNDEHMPECFVGGNASKLLEWLNAGRVTNMYGATQGLLKAFYAGCYFGVGEKSKFESSIVVSTEPKHEVAFGLVSGHVFDATKKDDDKVMFLPAALKGKEKPNEARVVCGASVKIDGKWFKSTDTITKKDLYSVVNHCEKLESLYVGVYAAFVKTFNNIIVDYYEGIDENIKNKLKINIDMRRLQESVISDMTVLEEKKNDSLEKIVLEPIFIKLLRATMKDLL